jgi:hypothetical protein
MHEKVGPVRAMKAYVQRGGTAPLILNLGTRWRQAISLDVAVLPVANELPVPIQEESGWTPQPVWTRK